MDWFSYHFMQSILHCHFCVTASCFLTRKKILVRKLCTQPITFKSLVAVHACISRSAVSARIAIQSSRMFVALDVVLSMQNVEHNVTDTAESYSNKQDNFVNEVVNSSLLRLD